MRRTATTVLVALLALLALTACSAEDQAGSPTEPPAPQETAAAEPTPDPEPSAETPAPDPTETASENSYADRGTSARGNLIKEVGDLAGLTTQDGDPLVDITLTGVRVDPECTYPHGTERPVNGHHVAFDFEILTYPALAAEPDPSFWASVHQFNAFEPDGTRINDPRSGAILCLDESDQIPVPIGPGEKVTGSIVLDFPGTSGVLVYPLNGGGGWEWQF